MAMGKYQPRPLPSPEEVREMVARLRGLHGHPLVKVDPVLAEQAVNRAKAELERLRVRWDRAPSWLRRGPRP